MSVLTGGKVGCEKYQFWRETKKEGGEQVENQKGSEKCLQKENSRMDSE